MNKKFKTSVDKKNGEMNLNIKNINLYFFEDLQFISVNIHCFFD